jgi:hypothetical protein
MENSTVEFANNWFVVKRAVIDADTVRLTYRHVLDRARGPTIALGDNQIPDAPVGYADPLTDTLLEKIRGSVEQNTGLKLWPTYSYFRVYQRGNLLKAHRDRPSCEVSMTVSLGMDAPEPWPIWIAGPMGTSSVSLNPGDGLIYRGCDCYHWREPFGGSHLAQLFLHYVDRDGPNTEWKFDKRPRLSSQ